MRKNLDSKIDIVHIAKLARLELEANELSSLTKDMEIILEYVHLLSDVDLDAIEPTAHVTPMVNVYRADEVGKTMEKRVVLDNAPEILNDDYIKVPLVIDNE